MSVDTNLLINSNYGAQHIHTILTKALGLKITDVEYKEDHVFFDILSSGHQIRLYVGINQEHSGLTVTYLSCGSREVTIELLKNIASITGGMFQASDSSNEWISFQDPHEDYAKYWMKKGLLSKGSLRHHAEREAFADKVKKLFEE